MLSKNLCIAYILSLMISGEGADEALAEFAGLLETDLDAE